MHRVSIGLKSSFGPQSKNLGSIIRGFNSAVRPLLEKSDWTLRGKPDTKNIIRDKAVCHRIKTYIRDNPKNWEEDRQYPKPPDLET